jgi:holo-[acyl-carrier protein] synthase
MIKGIGTDLVAIKRISDIYERHGDRFANKILGANELSDFSQAKDKPNFLAKRFAAKEAVSKAFGLGLAGGLRWQDIELGHFPSGQPEIMLSGQAHNRLMILQASRVHISLSDDHGMVCAFVVIE